MPSTNVYFFTESTGDSPVFEWLRDLRHRDSRAYAKGVAILAHGLTKEDRLPSRDIHRALQRKKVFQANPGLHTYDEEL